MIEIINDSADEVDEDLIADYLAHCFRELKLPKNSELTVHFVDLKRIQELNKEFRGNDLATDVLSFPIDAEYFFAESSHDAKSVKSSENNILSGNFQDDNMPLILGDIFVCMEYIKNNDELAESDTLSEMLLLIAHSLLHLLGMDHEVEAEREKMFTLQKSLLDLWKTGVKSGFVTVIGRPNVGKSTLINVLLNENLLITSDKPETTRKNVIGILNFGGVEDEVLDENTNNPILKYTPNSIKCQAIFVDTPGIHKPRTLLGKRLNKEAHHATVDADIVLFLMPADEPRGKGDEIIATNLHKLLPKTAIKIAILTKTDLAEPSEIRNRLLELDSLMNFDEIIPLSAIGDTARDKEQLEILKHLIAKYLPFGSKLYPDDILTDESLEEQVAEIIRGEALSTLFDELTHSFNVLVDDMYDTRSKSGNILQIDALLIVERDSQKPIIIGKKGEHLRRIGEKSRKKIEELTGKKVMLKTKVVVRKNWQNDAKMLNKFGL
ncbi:MAG: GTPase Era [Bifidobacteriaceae bacterium]|jgi:GTP-binding protein Era|nr:GTPase Era [Bifidobacteriaceae bacterium]